MSTNSVLARLAVNISANTAEFNRRLSETQKGLTSFTGGITKLAGTLGIAFGTQQVAAFAFEVSKLAGEAEGVRAAFERLPNNIKLMEDLKRATGGTVSELDLMKRAVQAANFDISLGALPRLLEFATLRAQQTGQSVDYLVDSIVTGIGRKSKLILDNLGISAVQLNEALGGVTTGIASIGDVADAVGRIAEDNLKNMAGWSENASTKAQRLTAEWTNFKIAMGGGANSTGVMAEAIDSLTKLLQNLTAFLSSEASQALWNYLKLVLLVPRKTLDAINAALEWIATNNKANEVISDAENQKIIEEVWGKPSDVKATTSALEDHAEAIDKVAFSLSKLKSIVGLGSVSDALDFSQSDLSQMDGFDPNADKTPAFLSDETLDRYHEASIGVLGLAEAYDGLAYSVEQVEDASSATAQAIQDQWIDIGPMISNGIAQVADGFGRAAVGAEDFGKVVLESLATFAQAFGAALIATGVGKIAFDNFSGPAMVAAGAVLVAAAGALKGVINNRPNLGAGGSRSSSVGGTSVSRNFGTVNGSLQNSAPQYIAVLRGEDIWISQQNFARRAAFAG